MRVLIFYLHFFDDTLTDKLSFYSQKKSTNVAPRRFEVTLTKCISNAM